MMLDLGKQKEVPARDIRELLDFYDVVDPLGSRKEIEHNRTNACRKVYANRKNSGQAFDITILSIPHGKSY